MSESEEFFDSLMKNMELIHKAQELLVGKLRQELADGVVITNETLDNYQRGADKALSIAIALKGLSSTPSKD